MHLLIRWWTNSTLHKSTPYPPTCAQNANTLPLFGATHIERQSALNRGVKSNLSHSMIHLVARILSSWPIENSSWISQETEAATIHLDAAEMCINNGFTYKMCVAMNILCRLHFIVYRIELPIFTLCFGAKWTSTARKGLIWQTPFYLDCIYHSLISRYLK